MDFHHIIFDGTSYRVLLEDINAAYAGQKPMQEKYTGYEWALDEERLRASVEYDEAKEYWEKLLADAEKEMLPPADAQGKVESVAHLIYHTELNNKDIKDFAPRIKSRKTPFSKEPSPIR